jgi:RND family efflux transporter MFP subunit
MNHNKKMYSFSLAMTVAVSCAASLLSGCGKDESQSASVKVPPLVSAIEARTAASTQSVVLSGQLRAQHETALAFRVAGKIATRNVDAGQSVKAGDVLFTLDDTDYNLRLTAMRAQESAAKAVLDNANQELARHQRMLEKQLISQAQFDRVSHSCVEAKAGYDAAVSARKNAENDSHYTKLVADSPAIISEVLADVGQVVGAGTPVLMTARDNEIEAEAYIPEKFASLVKIGDAAAIRVNAVGNATGVLREVAGMADPRTRTYRARIAFKNPAAELRLGMSADVTLQVPLAKSGVLVPADAICDGHGMPVHVWVIGTDGVARIQNIATEGVQNGMFIVSGVNPGDKIVVDGARFLTTPGKVRVAGEDSSDNDKNR